MVPGFWPNPISLSRELAGKGALYPAIPQSHRTAPAPLFYVLIRWFHFFLLSAVGGAPIMLFVSLHHVYDWRYVKAGCDIGSCQSLKFGAWKFSSFSGIPKPHFFPIQTTHFLQIS